MPFITETGFLVSSGIIEVGQLGVVAEEREIFSYEVWIEYHNYRPHSPCHPEFTSG